MEPITITYAAHQAMLDYVSGQGVLLRPSRADDVVLSGLHVEHPDAPFPGAIPASAMSLHEADWSAAIRDLRQRGFELVADEWEMPLVLGVAEDGRELVALMALDAA